MRGGDSGMERADLKKDPLSFGSNARNLWLFLCVASGTTVILLTLIIIGSF